MSSGSPTRAHRDSSLLGRLPFPPPVLDHLWVEGDGPGHEVDPANHLVYDANDCAVYHQKPNPGARKEFGIRMHSVKFLEEAPMHICARPPFPLFETTWVGDASLPGLIGVISVQISSHLSNILRNHLERGIFLSERDYNLLGRRNLICGRVQFQGLAPGWEPGNGAEHIILGSAF